MLDYPRDRIIVGSLVAAELLRGLLEPFLMERLQIERKGRLEHFLQETDEATGAVLRFGDVTEGFFDFSRGADANFIPVEKALLKGPKGPIRLGARGRFPANGIQEWFEHQPRLGFRGIVTLFERKKLRQDALLVRCGRHSRFTYPLLAISISIFDLARPPQKCKIKNLKTRTPIPLPPLRQRDQPQPWGRIGPRPR